MWTFFGYLLTVRTRLNISSHSKNEPKFVKLTFYTHQTIINFDMDTFLMIQSPINQVLRFAICS